MHLFLAAIKANWPQHMEGPRDEFFFKKKVKKKSYNGFLPDFLNFYRFSTILNMKQTVFWVLLSPS